MIGCQDFRRSITSVRLMVDFGVEQGMAVSGLLEGSRLSLDMLAYPNAEITADQELRVIRNLVDRLDNIERQAVELGRQYNFSAYGLWGYGLMCSATAGDALKLALRFLPLTYAFTVIAYREEGEMGILDFGEPQLEPDLKRFVVARDMAAARVLMRELVGDDFIVMEESHNTFTFPRYQLARRLPQANPVTAALCEQQCRELMEQRRVNSGVRALVTYYLEHSGGRKPSLAAAADHLHMSERTLKRHLQREGTQFRELVESVLKNRAQHFLRHRDLSIAEVAERLGFNDASTFSQAFKRWTGKAPSYWQAENNQRD